MTLTPTVFSSEIETGQLQFQKVELSIIRGLENEVCLMKSLLASSPLLKKMIVYGLMAALPKCSVVESHCLLRNC